MKNTIPLHTTCPISHSDRNPRLTYLDTIYNGIDEQLFDLGTGSGDYLLYFGRIHPHKGTQEAIHIAIASGKKLILCGLIQDQAYFDEKVKPFLNHTTIIYKGNADSKLRNELLGDAIALLHPISFEEPFGLSVAEAMMCGTPVIAFERGSMKELIVNGKTGFLVSNIEDAATAVSKLPHINRSDCRNHAMQKFSSGVLAANYIRLYKQILEGC